MKCKLLASPTILFQKLTVFFVVVDQSKAKGPLGKGQCDDTTGISILYLIFVCLFVFTYKYQPSLSVVASSSCFMYSISHARMHLICLSITEIFTILLVRAFTILSFVKVLRPAPFLVQSTLRT